jgi:hypothetical protein
LILLTAVTGAAQDTEAPELHKRWVYLSTNLLVDDNVEKDVGLLDRAAGAGYTDAKFMRWDGLPERYVRNVGRFRQACRELHLDCIAAVCPVG